MTAPDTAAVYVRHSTEDKRQALDRSMEGQEHECRDRAAALGLDVVHVFAERAGTSASHLSTKDRPEFAAALAGLRRGEYATLIVYALDRATRRGMGAAGEMLDLCDEVGARIISVRDNLDSSLPDARIRVAIMSEMARSEVQVLSERTTWGKANARRLRKASSSRTAFGVRLKEAEVPEGVSPYELVPEEADALRRTLAAILEGATLGEACRMLNDEGWVSRGGKCFTPPYLSHLFRSPHMRGHRGHKPRGGVTQVVLGDDGRPFEWTEPIIADADLARYERVMASRRKVRGGTSSRAPTKGAPRSLLTSVLRCATCGDASAIGAHRYTNGTESYRCRGACSPPAALPMEGADAWVTNAILRRLAALDRNDSPILDFLAANWVERTGAATPVAEVEDEIEVLSANLAKVQKEFYAQVGRADFMDEETYSTIKADLNDRLEDASRRLREARLASVDAGDVFADFLPGAASTDGNPAESESWLALPLHKRRQLVNMVVERVTVAQQEPYRVRHDWEKRISIAWVEESSVSVSDYYSRFGTDSRRCRGAES